ncbi:hypothetical protein Tco_0688746 [Tanacetum coccineum]
MLVAIGLTSSLLPLHSEVPKARRSRPAEENSRVGNSRSGKDSEIVKGKREQSRSLTLKAKKESSDEEILTSDSEDEEKLFQRSKNDKKDKSERKCFRFEDPNHLIGECPKPPRSKNQRAFVKETWSDSGEDEEEKTKDETCLVAQASNEVLSETKFYSDDLSSIDELDLVNKSIMQIMSKSYV